MTVNQDSRITHQDSQSLDYLARDTPGPVVSSGINLAFILGFVRRRLWTILFCVLFMGSVGFAYFVAVPAPYTAAAVLKIDTRKFQLFQQPGSLGDQDAGALEVESHLEALKSENLMLKVINELHLADDPEFGLAAAIPIISKLIEERKPESEAWRTRNALRIFNKRYTVERRGVFLVEINFESANAQRSAQIANTVAQTYIAEQLDAKYEVTRQGSKWLEGRIKELRDQVTTAEKAVIDYKAQHQIVDAGNGRLITEQQLTDLNNQLIAAHAKTSQMRARLDQVNVVLNDPTNAGIINATAGEPLSNQLIVKLRTQYLELAARETEWSEKYGRSHLAVANLRARMRGLRASILDELQRLGMGYRSDYEVASAAEKAVDKRLHEAIAESQRSNEAQVTLRGLETSAQTYKAVHDNFVKRYTEANEQQAFPYTEARLITKATSPVKRTYRKSLLIVAMTPLMGLVLGIGLGALRDFLDRGFRTSSQIETLLGLACLALVPLQIRPKNRIKRPPKVGSGPSLISKLGIASYVIDQPFSRFAEAIRTVKLAASLNSIAGNNKVVAMSTGIPNESFSRFTEAIRMTTRDGDISGMPDDKIVGITSALPDEGKSTIAAALALSIAQVGGRCVLVDCDLRNPSLSMAIKPNANVGIIEVLSGQAALDEALNKEIYLSLAFLPVVSKERVADSSELLSSIAMKKLFERLRHSYDYVIVDLPPLAPLPDVSATTHFVDSYLLAVEWGRSSTAIVQHALSRAPRVYERIVGAVLNKVDMKALKLYDGTRAGYYQNEAYARYGHVD